MPLSHEQSLTLEIVEGITEHSNRVALKGVFSAFGDVLACWVPPIDRREIDCASVRFALQPSAEAAKTACDAGQVFFQGLPVKVRYRVGGGPRVGNSDVGNAVGGNSPSRGGNQNRGRRSRSRDNRRDRGRRSRSRRRPGRSRSRARKRSRSRDKLQDDKQLALPAMSAVPPPEMQMPPEMLMPPMPVVQPPWSGFSGVAPAATGGASLGMPGMPPEMSSLVDAATAAVDAEAEAERKEAAKKAREERNKQLKRGPGVAAMVQAALKRASAQTSISKKKDDEENQGQKKKESEMVKEVDESEEEEESDEDSKKEAAEAQAAKEREAREREERKAKEMLEKEKEKAKREAVEKEQEVERQKKEAIAREDRVRAGVEAAKKQQAEFARQQALKAAKKDNLYGEMPEAGIEKDPEDEERRIQAMEKQKSVNLNLPPEDRSKVIFLDVDGVLRPARAGSFDILDVEAAQKPDTSDWFTSAIAALRHIVERTGAIIVLSSEWRRNKAMHKAVDDILTVNRLRTTSTGTPQLQDKALKNGDAVRIFAEKRTREITQWLNDHEGEVNGYVVLDDVNLAIADEDKKSGLKVMGPKLVQTWPLCGLTMGNAKTAVRILNGEMIHKVLVERPKAPVAV
eukprot:gnl/TRDRNA2_/TRDRNA2_192790_c0_seq1.p1 gnl/TRDRNA2_/TRDRNA2_192790_c0~~gnl/TRDRNA2_/TRDRNA2_192790_c0_seq1.p1  ORF type:complete len:628 (-),score=172.71 gnl/TRDRNA2_/TRDRNA2_192790_c0_seq1:59-1942(-)